MVLSPRFLFLVCLLESLCSDASPKTTSSASSNPTIAPTTKLSILPHTPVSNSSVEASPNVTASSTNVTVSSGNVMFSSANVTVSSAMKTSVKKELSTSGVVATEGGPLPVQPNENIMATTNVSKPLEFGKSSSLPSSSMSFRTGERRGKINARKGAPDLNETFSDSSEKKLPPPPPPPSPNGSSSDTHVAMNASLTKTPKKKKPLYTISRGDDFSESGESFIESSTTGRDYVFPIVLGILAVPALVYLGKFIYRRGTEFTERQQYHRMYLIDGMYNAR